MDFPFLYSVSVQLLAALPVTLVLFVLSVALGAVFAIGLVALRFARNPLLSAFARFYVFVFRGSPLLVQMFLIYYGLGQFPAVRHSFAWPVLKDPFSCAVLVLAMCTAAYQAEIMRGGILAIPQRELEAARACGMSGTLLLRRIVVPVAARLALPAYSTEIVLMVKSTALASLVTVWEVTGTAQKLISETYRTMEIFIVATVIYLLVNFFIIRILLILEYFLSAHLRDRITVEPGQSIAA